MTGAGRAPHPRLLSWADADPARHPFDVAAAPAVIRGLPPAGDVPTRPAGHPADPAVIRWAHTEGAAWAQAMSLALVGHYGPWAAGWRWSGGEGDLDGGPVGAWCCPRDSMTTPQATLAVVAAALGEWRLWLEDLAGRFTRFLPLVADPRAGIARDAWERAVAHLITVVVDRTEADSAWYSHAEQVLGWFLTAAGVPAHRHAGLIDEAIGWAPPSPPVVADVAERIATSVTRTPDA